MNWFNNIINSIKNFFVAPPVVLTPVNPGLQTEYFVNIHFVNNPKALAEIASWGAKGVRMDFTPYNLQTNSDGTINWTDLTNLITQAAVNNLKVMFITPYLADAAKLVNPPITTPSEYARYVGQVAQHFADYPIIWEIMNEADLPSNAATPASRYNTYLTATLQAIKEVAPNHLVISSGTSGHDVNWDNALTTMIPKVDGVSLHPYGVSAADFASTLEAVNVAYGKRFPVYITEFGVLAKDTNAAKNLLEYLKAAKGYTPVFNIYVYQENPSGIDSGYGIYNIDGTPAPTLAAVQQLKTI